MLNATFASFLLALSALFSIVNPLGGALIYSQVTAQRPRHERVQLAWRVAVYSGIVMLTALLSILRASLSLPGIAGIILTVGIAVDANVLIYERIREELRNGVTPQAAIRAGFEKAFSAIADSNVTALIAGLVLWVVGSGPIRGFAIVLVLGIATSMFTSLLGSRALITLLYGGRRKVAKLSIG